MSDLEIGKRVKVYYYDGAYPATIIEKDGWRLLVENDFEKRQFVHEKQCEILPEENLNQETYKALQKLYRKIGFGIGSLDCRAESSYEIKQINSTLLEMNELIGILIHYFKNED